MQEFTRQNVHVKLLLEYIRSVRSAEHLQVASWLYACWIFQPASVHIVQGG